MRNVMTTIAMGGLMALGACNASPTEQKADAIEQTAEDQADALEDQSDFTSNEVAEEVLENTAAAVRAEGENEADAVREAN